MTADDVERAIAQAEALADDMTPGQRSEMFELLAEACTRSGLEALLDGDQEKADIMLGFAITASDQVTKAQRRLNVNSDPLRVEPIPVCRQCRKRAPWCSCGAMDYDTPRQTDRASFVCPRCGAESFNPNDIVHGYCGRCHAFTGTGA